MAKISRYIGTASQLVDIFIQDSSSSVGAGLTGLVFNSSGLICYYHRNTASSAVAVSLVTMTVGTFTSSGFKEVDSSHMPGLYQLALPNAALASGADTVVFELTGATNMTPVLLEIDLKNAPAIQKNTALSNFCFPMFDSNGNPKSGLGTGVSAQRIVSGGSLTSCDNTPTEIGSGWYVINLTAADLNGGVIGLRFSAVGAADTDVTIPTQG